MSRARALSRIAIGALLFDIVWGASVLLAGRGHWATGALVAVLGGCAHATLVRAAPALLARIVAVAALGAAVDLALIGLGVIRFATPSPLWAPAIWFFALWLHFAPSVPLLFSWLRTRMWLAVVLGVAGGPLAYWVAERLGAVELAQPWSLLVIAGQWGVLFPLAVHWLGLKPSAPPAAAIAHPAPGAPR